MQATALCRISMRFGHDGRAMGQMSPISITTIAMRIARYVKGSALLTTYLVPMKPVLHSRTKIAGAARAANVSKSLVICRPCRPIICHAARTDRPRLPGATNPDDIQAPHVRSAGSAARADQRRRQEAAQIL